MKYILSDNIALRSWIGAPYTYHRLGDDLVKPLTKDEFETLISCDGTREMENTMMLDILHKKNLIRIAHEGEFLSNWQKLKKYNNRYFPKAAWMITGKCNFNCLHCFNAVDNERLQSEFSLEEAETLLDQMQACGIHSLMLTGGEPLLHPNFMEILNSIYDHSMVVFELNTNGHFITQELLDEMKAIGCKPLMKISFDGIGYHDWLRDKDGAESDALGAIKLCVENGFKVKVQTNVHRKNLGVMLETGKLLDSLGVETLRIIRTSESLRWTQNANTSTLTIEEYFDSMTKLCHEYAKTDCKMNLNIWHFAHMMPSLKKYALVPIRFHNGEYHENAPLCKKNRLMISIGANGNLYPCFQMSSYYEGNSEVLGNVKRDGLQSVLREGKYLCEISHSARELEANNDKCATCPWFKNCVGGCRALALAFTWDKWGKDQSNCTFFKNGYIDKLAQALPSYECITQI